jgi:ketosteroid isomerase-like protein
LNPGAIIFRRLAITAFACASVASAQNKSTTPATTSAKAARESLLKADRALSSDALQRGITAAFEDAAAHDALFLYEGAPIIAGHDNVVALLAAQPELKVNRIQWLPLVVTVSSDGLLGATWGAVSVRQPQSDSARFGRYISTWRRSQNGEWKLAAFVEMGISDQKVVMPDSVPTSFVSSKDPSTGQGGPFAKADLEFSKMAGARGAPLAFRAFAAPNATTLPGTGEIVIGPAAIHSRMLESPVAKAKWDWHPVYSESSGSGDLGFTVGEAVIAIPGASGATNYESKYLTVWRRQPDGSIRFIVDGGNGR